ncbi:MAG: DNA polymerase III subunit gamma/tau [Gemmatimonadetes bacterium]|nr:DNA polymerase III subunit gamma/tau [Gemmatimonadota bacterium]
MRPYSAATSPGSLLAHLALARKYRPRKFSEVTTQEHVSETLRRAVAGDRVGHAYLFCGPRGVGKTTLARVLAMSLNCQLRDEQGEPCGACESCERIWGGHTALDVIEIDAASNRGVDDARDLRERAMYAPSEPGRYKIYIVDEAHMLTREAWNALLKILEEPPPRVIFVFATTEATKIQQSAAPILSRCQRFDFRRIGVADIMAQLGRVLAQEGLAASEDALRLVARKADGGMRDALSLLDQVLSLTGGSIEPDAVRRVLGLVEDERYLELLDLLRDARHGGVFELVERLLDQGYDLVEFYHGLVDVLRGLLRLKLGAGPWAEVSEELRDAFRSRAEGFAPADLVRMLALASELEANGSMRRSANPRLLIEMLLLRFSYLDRTVDLEELLRAVGGAGPAGGRGTPAGPGTGGSPRPPLERPLAPRADAPTPSAPPVRPEPPARTPARGAAGGLPTAPAVSPAPTAAPAPAADAVSAWGRMLDEGQAPSGMGAFLRVATVTEGPGGEVHVRVPGGPALERLRDPVVLNQVSTVLSRHLGRGVRVVPDGPEAVAEPARITQQTVRQARLRELISREPVLQQAVEELDLELLD